MLFVTVDNLNTLLASYCFIYVYRWFALRKEAEEFYNIQVNPDACPKGGHKWYQPMKLEGATMPPVPFLVPDDSSDRYDPIPQSKYTSTKYD
jgi:hypothetical protein